eukprot:COSAG01_NODE_19003_length_1038_cov_1.000000_2_plen_63_part_00
MMMMMMMMMMMEDDDDDDDDGGGGAGSFASVPQPHPRYNLASPELCSILSSLSRRVHARRRS